MPLHGEGKARRVFDIDRLGRAIIRVAVDHHARAGFLDPLPVQRVGQHFGRAHHTVEHAAFGKAHVMAQFEFLFDGAIGGHPVVHSPRQIANLRIERPTHGDVHFLKPAAKAEEGLAPRHTGPYQRQRDGVARAVKGTVGLRLRLTIFFGMHIGAPAGQQETVADLQQFLDRDKARIARHDKRQTARNLGNRFGVHLPACVDGVLIVQQVGIANDTNDGSGHELPLIHHGPNIGASRRGLNLSSAPSAPTGAHAALVRYSPRAVRAPSAPDRRRPERPPRQSPGPWGGSWDRRRFDGPPRLPFF